MVEWSYKQAGLKARILASLIIFAIVNYMMCTKPRVLPQLVAGQEKDKPQSGGRPRKSAPVTVHKDCVLDEETGEMVELGHRDEDWLNGRQQMPHERRDSLSHSGSLPSALSQANVPSCHIVSITKCLRSRDSRVDVCNRLEIYLYVETLKYALRLRSSIMAFV